MVKRWIALILSAVIFCGAAGCSRLSGEEETEETATSRRTVRVTVPEGFTVYQIAKLLEEKQVCSAEDFIEAVNNPPEGNVFSSGIGNPGERPFLLEGYLFPDTYDFYVGEAAPKALGRFLKNMKSKLTPEYYERAEELGYSMDEILTIASIIQEEAGFPAEDKKVASVLHNRLSSKSFPRLQFNVTFEYLDKSVAPVFTGARKKYDGLYNTYVKKGLPAGPITNPGKISIEAALYPEDTDYYYFFTYAGFNYYYSETYEEHSREYAKRRNWTTPTG